MFRQQASVVLQSMREELDDHRTAINENTTEMASAYEFMNELSLKLDKLTERLDELALHVMGRREEPVFEIQPLSSREKEVFRALYGLTEVAAFTTYDAIARSCSLTRQIVSAQIAAMIQKGVPVLKRSDSNRVFVRLDPCFRELQAKKNIIGLDAPLTCWMR